MSVQEQLLTLLLNSKKGDALPELTSLANTDFVIVYDVNNAVIGKIKKTNLSLTGGSGSSTKIDVTIDNDGQSVYSLPTKPDNIDLTISRIRQDEGTDYTYNNQTGVLTLINASIINSIKTNSLFDVRGFNNAFSKKEKLTIASAGQTDFNLIEIPKNIDVVLNRTNLIEGTDYDYNNTTGLLEITNTSFINQITLNSILEVRKIF